MAVSECFSEEAGKAVHNCSCHESCGSCGYRSSPTGPADCISCKQGYSFLSNGDNTTAGECIPMGAYGWVNTQPQNTSAAEVGLWIAIVACLAGLMVVVALYVRTSSKPRSRYLEVLPLSERSSGAGGYGAQNPTASLEETQTLLGGDDDE